MLIDDVFEHTLTELKRWGGFEHECKLHCCDDKEEEEAEKADVLGSFQDESID